MSEMIDRVAQAIDPQAFDRRRFDAMADVTTQPGAFERGQDRARAKARAAIEAMREPTEAMDLAGGNTPIDAESGSEVILCGQATKVWHEMIDAALAS